MDEHELFENILNDGIGTNNNLFLKPIAEEPMNKSKKNSLTPNRRIRAFKKGKKLQVGKRSNTFPKKDKEAGDSKVYECHHPSCAKVFADRNSYRKHIITHGEKQYICQAEGCGKKFLDNSKLKRHMLVHSGEKPYKCELCDKRFSLDFNLRTHLRIHTGEKPYVCSYEGCEKRFSQSSNLSAHEKTHLLMNKIESPVHQPEPPGKKKFFKVIHPAAIVPEKPKPLVILDKQKYFEEKEAEKKKMEEENKIKKEKEDKQREEREVNEREMKEKEAIEEMQRRKEEETKIKKERERAMIETQNQMMMMKKKKNINNSANSKTPVNKPNTTTKEQINKKAVNEGKDNHEEDEEVIDINGASFSKSHNNPIVDNEPKTHYQFDHYNQYNHQEEEDNDDDDDEPDEDINKLFIIPDYLLKCNILKYNNQKS